MKAAKGTELLLTTDNKVGKLEEIAKAIKDNGINIRAISAWAFDDKAYFRIVASDNAKTKEILQTLGKVEEKDVVIVDMPDEVGQLFQLASKLKDNNIDIHHIFGTTSEPGKSAIIIFSSDDNAKALQVSTS
jgi:hypothetical protein